MSDVKPSQIAQKFKMPGQYYSSPLNSVQSPERCPSCHLGRLGTASNCKDEFHPHNLVPQHTEVEGKP